MELNAIGTRIILYVEVCVKLFCNWTKGTPTNHSTDIVKKPLNYHDRELALHILHTLITLDE